MIDPQRRRSQLSRPHVMDPIHPRTKEPLADTGFSFLHPGDVCSKVTGQRPPLLPRFFPRIHPRGAAETLGTARRRSPFTEALSSPTPPPRLNGSESRSSAAEVSVPDWKLHSVTFLLLFYAASHLHSWAPPSKEGTDRYYTPGGRRSQLSDASGSVQDSPPNVPIRARW